MVVWEGRRAGCRSMAVAARGCWLVADDVLAVAVVVGGDVVLRDAEAEGEGGGWWWW